MSVNLYQFWLSISVGIIRNLRPVIGSIINLLTFMSSANKVGKTFVLFKIGLDLR